MWFSAMNPFSDFIEILVESNHQECEDPLFFHNFLIFEALTSAISFQLFKHIQFLPILGENVEVLGHTKVPLPFKSWLLILNTFVAFSLFENISLVASKSLSCRIRMSSLLPSPWN